MKNRRYRSLVAVAAALMTVSSLASCTTAKEPDPGSVDVGLLIPLSGAFEAPGAAYRDAFELYLDVNGGKLGGRDVNVSYGDEGDGPKVSLPSAKKLISDDDVDVMAGAASSANYAAVAPKAIKAEIPFIGIGGQPDLKKLGIDNEWLWQSAVLPDRSGKAIAPYVEENVDGSVYAIGPKYAGGYAIVGGFVEPFLKEGGELANPSGEPEWTPWPRTKDFSEYFDKIAETDAKAIYAFYLGVPAVDFVKQYAESKVSHLPLYGAFLTESPALEAQGEAAKGVYSAMIYGPNIDNAANRTFVSKWGAKYPDRQTSLYSMDGWDTGIILNQAIASIPDNEEVTGKRLNEALGNLGTINSPRGSWQFSEKTHAPIQKWYLRKVAKDGPSLANVVIKDLATLDG